MCRTSWHLKHGCANIDKQFFALESREMNPIMRIAHYPHRSQTFIEFMLSDRELTGTKSKIELRFSHGTDQPFSLFAEADVESNSYSFDLPQEANQIDLFWAAFTSGTQLTVFNGYGIEIGSFSLSGSKKAATDFSTMIKRKE
jgi:hypothetical protein